MMDSYDATIGKMSEKEFLNADFLPELEKLKIVATKYFEAKRKQKGHLEAVNKDEAVVEKITYDDATIKKAKDLLDAMKKEAEDVEILLAMQMLDIKPGNASLVPMDFLVNDLKIGTEVAINKMSMNEVMNVLNDIISQEKTKEIETEEIEDEFSLG